MRCITPQITWHNREPVLSLDIDPTVDSSHGYYRVATGGADSHLLIWHLRQPDTLKPDLLCVADLTRHQKAVNIVRFSPDGNFIASADDDAYVYIWRNEGKTKTEEIWLTDKILRRHLEDIADLSWSSDGAFLVTASVDNTAIMWDVKKNSVLYTWSDHNGLVQGITFDPLREFVATMCTDRQLRVYNSKTGKMIPPKTLKYPDSWIPQTPVESVNEAVDVQPEVKDEGGNDLAAAGEQAGISGPKPAGQPNKLFHDDTLGTFCRRLSFSPRGELLMVPGGELPPNCTSGKENSPPEGTPSNLDSKGKKRKSVGAKENANNGVVIFCRNSFANPCAIIPTGTSYSIATRFCPVYFQRNVEQEFSYDSDLVNPTKKSERTIACVGKLRPKKQDKRVLMDMPYRLVYAIATNNSVIIGDTQSNHPLAVIRNIHVTRMSDLTWSSDGRVLLVSSTDGYCSIVSFAEMELGTPTDDIPEFIPTCFPVLPEEKKKEIKEPKKKNKEKDKDMDTSKSKPKETTPSAKKAKARVSTPGQSKKDQEPKKEGQLESAFKRMEKQSKIVKPVLAVGAEGVEDEQTPSSPATLTTTAADAPEEGSDSKTPKPVQKNTLLKWIIKTPKTGESSASATTPKTGETKKSVGPLRQSSAAKGKLLGFTPDQYIPSIIIPRAKSPQPPLDDVHSLSTNTKITSAEIDRLERAPIIVDLESSEGEPSSDSHSAQLKMLPAATAEKLNVHQSQDVILLSTTNGNNDVSNGVRNSEVATHKSSNGISPYDGMPLLKPEVEIDQKSPQAAAAEGCENIGQKRPATSPLAPPIQPKQPRRVQLITLSSSASVPKKTD